MAAAGPSPDKPSYDLEKVAESPTALLVKCQTNSSHRIRQDNVVDEEKDVPKDVFEVKGDSKPAPPVPYTIFTKRQKGVIVGLVSVAATFSGLSGNIYFPAIPAISNNLSVSKESVTLTVTAYMIFQGISPSFWGALADVKGRRLTYMCTFMVYLGACIGLAETKHYYQLVILRCLQSTGSASTIAIGAGVLGDITTREERGGYMGIYQAGLLSPTAIGPILGGIFAGTLGWRSIFWFLTIYAGAFLVVLMFFLPETLRSLVGNGSIPAVGLAKSPLAYIQRRRRRNDPETALSTPTTPPTPKSSHINLLSSLQILFEKEVTFIIIFLSVYYTGWQIIVASMSSLFSETYHLTSIDTGLTFIANGVGCILGTLLTGRFLDWDYRRLKLRYVDSDPSAFPLEHARLRTIWLYSFLEIAFVLIFGWTIDRRVHISLPIISSFIIGWCSNSIQSVTTTFMVDLFPEHGASATAALNLARCLMGAGGTAAVLPVTKAIGVGWTFTLFSGILALSLGFLVVQLWRGPRWRRKREERERERVES